MKKKTKLSTPSAEVAWAGKRARNLDSMLKKVQNDDVALFTYSTAMLDVLANLLTGVGDDAGALYVSSLARRLEGIAQRARPDGLFSLAADIERKGSR